jgi:patatin-like phospholipase/acyl hydrolase
MSRPVRVLSIDGGGIRGYIPALVLAEVERRAGVPASQLFDLAVGTSTGAIISIGLSVGLTASELAEFYPRYGSRIFGPEPDRLSGGGSNLGHRMDRAARTLGAPFGGNPALGGNARHDASGLESVLREVFGEQKVSEAQLELAVTSFDAEANRPVVISRRDARNDPGWDMSLWEAARATSAAPTYLAPFVREWAGRRCRFVDGGVWANNPAGVALAESVPLTAERGLTGDSVVMLSIGTGVAATKETFVGTDPWIASAKDLVTMATGTTAGHTLAVRALSPSRVTRLQVEDDRVAGKMDDPSAARLSVLHAATAELIASSGAAIDAVLGHLVARSG